MGRNYRKRKVEEEEEEVDEVAIQKTEEPPRSLSEKLLDTKLLQKQRKREKGVNVEKLSGYSNTGTVLIQQFEDEEADEDAIQLGDTFANETLVAEEDPHMVKYIEEELRKRRGLLNPDGTEGAEKSEMEQLAESLYDTPANLAVRPHVEEGGGSDQWMTGIVEVQLPVEYRLANIEATEMAKATLLNKGRYRPKAEFKANQSSTIPASLSSNFSLHRKAFSKGHAGGTGPTTTDQGSGGQGSFG
eukprot:CAMPEP_0198212538 /NCGR_PEP_ID=MMETSP1445-20131203/26523_1 /TAXON_ID=36898 /ORGANISM="Pyramimonas sp., Strain CCMP2087" /LENGTH=244 /DNA_ID=CAMNT_0043887005 /DNA_START=199 /DNA_END=930 /DNA_ORIENTATION=-